MPKILTRYDPDFFSKTPPVDKPAMRDLLAASYNIHDIEIAEEACCRIADVIKNKEFSKSLYETSPDLKGYDWAGYLYSSIVRVVVMLDSLRRNLPDGGIVFDFGAYFGNFSLAARLAGYDVTAVDYYINYEDNFKETTQLLKDFSIKIASTESFSVINQADAVLCMGVIEHIPHTPRHILQKNKSMLKSGGLLLLETPNLAYYYKRQALLHGQEIFPPIQSQYYTKEPFSGHHREYTMKEICWMLQEENLEIIEKNLFNYSYLSNPYFTQIVIDGLKAGYDDDTQREIMMFTARKTG